MLSKYCSIRDRGGHHILISHLRVPLLPAHPARSAATEQPIQYHHQNVSRGQHCRLPEISHQKYIHVTPLSLLPLIGEAPQGNRGEEILFEPGGLRWGFIRRRPGHTNTGLSHMVFRLAASGGSAALIRHFGMAEVLGFLFHFILRAKPRRGSVDLACI
jgi:hypothetical protein